MPKTVSKKQSKNSNLIASFDRAISLFKHFRNNVRRFNSLNLFTRRPNISQENVFSVGVLRQWLSLKVDIDTTGQGIGDDQQWGGQVIGTGVGMDSA